MWKNYPGGKGGVYQQLINLMPPHETYVETHSGGGSIIRNKRSAVRNIGIEIAAEVIRTNRQVDHNLRGGGIWELAAVSKILRAIYEPIFTKSSFGYRPGIDPINAVQELTFNLQFGCFGWVVEGDIKSFFDTIDHDWLIRMLAEKIKDRSL